MASALLCLRPAGLYCAAGDFYIDAWAPVERNVVTHAHADHARAGHARYLAAAEGAALLRTRLGDVTLETIGYGESVTIGDAKVSLHPAGHILGSAQVRVESRGEVWAVSGDYRVEADATCSAFEPVRCDTFVSESTFGLPVYRWERQETILQAIAGWWCDNAAAGRTSVLYAYACGKAQRILAGLPAGPGPILCHGAVEKLNDAYRASGVALPATRHASEPIDGEALGRALVIAPPSAHGSPWIRRFPDPSDAFASGWMQLRGTRRRRGVDRGFALSDHADWPALLQAIDATGAAQVLLTHGHSTVLVRWLQEQGRDAQTLATPFGDEPE